MERKLDRQQQGAGGADQGDKKDHRASSRPNRSPSSSPSVLSPGPAAVTIIRTPPISQPLSPATIITSPTTDHHPQGHYGRSYTCIFCKKGFSNAQALGGHMNIHRRDRAKLRESTSSAEDASMLDEETGEADQEPVLPLFVDKPTTTSVSQRDETESREQVRGAEGKPSVDLELRLSSTSPSSLPPPSPSSSSPSGGK